MSQSLIQAIIGVGSRVHMCKTSFNQNCSNDGSRRQLDIHSIYFYYDLWGRCYEEVTRNRGRCLISKSRHLIHQLSYSSIQVHSMVSNSLNRDLSYWLSVSQLCLLYQPFALFSQVGDFAPFFLLFCTPSLILYSAVSSHHFSPTRHVRLYPLLLTQYVLHWYMHIAIPTPGAPQFGAIIGKQRWYPFTYSLYHG